MEKKFLFMRKCKGNVLLNVILLLGLGFVILNGLFLIVLGRVQINKLKSKEKDEYYLQEKEKEILLKNTFKEKSDLNANGYNEQTVKTIDATAGNYHVTFDNTKDAIKVEKKINLSITEYYYYDYKDSNNNICFKRKKYYEIK